MTLSRGMVKGESRVLLCFRCRTVYGGRWCWKGVPEDSAFPSGYHRPQLSGDARHPTRWFFATPQVCWEISLLDFLLGCMARGGMSLTAIFEVYRRLWAFTVEGTMYATRQHFLAKTEVALLVWASVCLIEASPIEAAEFQWVLRPHHIAQDFGPLVTLLRRAFHELAGTHKCKLMTDLRCLIVDGKWCVQTAICNARDGGLVWDSTLATGFLTGCTERPVPGGKYCARHMRECTTPQEDCTITGHREVVGPDSVSLEYKVDGTWRPATHVAVPQVRAYELTLLRARTTTHADEFSTCNKDSRKGVPETFASRKSSGLLAAVTPCLQIAGVRPMYASESITQVLVFVSFVVGFFVDMRFLIYDNACGVVRSLNKKLRLHAASPVLAAAWGVVAGLQWVIDRLHWTYHTGCRDASTGWYVPGVDPHAHSALLGVDTEAAEQVFHIANRWQTVLSNTSPIHQEMFLLIFSWQHNVHHSCDEAVRKYMAAQKAASASDPEAASAPPPPLPLAGVLAPRRPRKRFKLCATASCGACAEPSTDARAGDVSSVGSSAPSDLSQPGATPLAGTSWAVLNAASATVHSVLLRQDVYSRCSWSFQGKADVVVEDSLRGHGYSLCGICYGARRVFV